MEVGLDSIAANDGAEECVDDDLRGCPEAAMASDVPLPIIAIGAVLWPCFVSDDGWIVDLCFASDQLILDLDVRDGAERIPSFVVRKMNVPSFFVVLPFSRCCTSSGNTSSLSSSSLYTLPPPPPLFCSQCFPSLNWCPSYVHY